MSFSDCRRSTFQHLLLLQLCFFVTFAVSNNGSNSNIVSPLLVNNFTDKNEVKHHTQLGNVFNNDKFDSHKINHQKFSELLNFPTRYQKWKTISTLSRLKLSKTLNILSFLAKTKQYSKTDHANKVNDIFKNPHNLKTVTNKQARYARETIVGGFYPRQGKNNLTVTSHKNIKRTSKGRRFLSSVHSSLKEHIKEGKTMWKISKKEIAKTFEKYYKCLEERIESLKKETFPIKALLAVEGERVQMVCKICYRPDQSEESQKTLWQVLRHETTSLEDLQPDSRFHVSKDHSLLIKDIDVEDAGQYFCLEKRDYAEVYQLDVFLTDRRRTVKLGEDLVTPDTYLLSHNLHIFTMWAPWGECNTCDRLGQKARVGQCTAKKIYEDIPIFPRDYPLMSLYKEGVPCHSTALPRHIRKLSEIGLRDSETQICPCQEQCPTDPPIISITDETGKVIEVVEAGFHSLKHQPPVLPPLIKRKMLFEPEKSHLLLKCPTDASPNFVHWARKEREVDPNEIKKLTRGRVWIDTVGRLHFNPLLLSDTDVYNCWNKNERIAIIKLLVVNEGNKHMKYYISYVGLGATVIGAIICVFCICCKKSDKNAQ